MSGDGRREAALLSPQGGLEKAAHAARPQLQAGQNRSQDSRGWATGVVCFAQVLYLTVGNQTILATRIYQKEKQGPAVA